MSPEESRMLGEIHADVRSLMAEKVITNERLVLIESAHNRLKGIVTATSAISGGLWATLVLIFPKLAQWWTDNPK